MVENCLHGIISARSASSLEHHPLLLVTSQAYTTSTVRLSKRQDLNPRSNSTSPGTSWGTFKKEWGKFWITLLLFSVSESIYKC